MKIYLSIVSILVTIQFGLGQQITLKARSTIEQNYLPQAYYPAFNAEGTLLLVTDFNYKGLYLYDLTSQKIIKISEEPGAGYEAFFTNRDPQQIYFKEDHLENGRRFKQLKMFSLKDGVTTNLTSPLRSLKELRNIRIKREYLKDRSSALYVASEDLRLILYKNSQRIELNPVGETTAYIWVSLAPSKDKILFYAASKGAYVCDLKGNILSVLGELEAPVWYDDEYVIGMKGKDDGERIIASSIWMYSIDGKIKQQISSIGEIAMHPTSSVKAKKIAYHTYDGEIVLVDVVLP